ncbi:MAG TPA: TIGR00725 family protein [Micromonosporaceae bacterium]|jgi:hypothetical protein
MAVQVAVCGPREASPEEERRARRVGDLLAGAGAVVVCGGGTGVMAAVAAGARARGGLVIGVLPGADRVDANRDLSAAVVTNMGEARNAIIVRSADAVIVIGGSWGTLSELALARGRGLPVVSLGGWRVADADGRPVGGVSRVETPEDAVRLALAGMAQL